MRFAYISRYMPAISVRPSAACSTAAGPPSAAISASRWATLGRQCALSVARQTMSRLIANGQLRSTSLLKGAETGSGRGGSVGFICLLLIAGCGPGKLGLRTVSPDRQELRTLIRAVCLIA